MPQHRLAQGRAAFVSPSRRRIARGFRLAVGLLGQDEPALGLAEEVEEHLERPVQGLVQLPRAAEGAVDLQDRPEHLAGPVGAAYSRRQRARLVERLQDGRVALPLGPDHDRRAAEDELVVADLDPAAIAEGDRGLRREQPGRRGT